MPATEQNNYNQSYRYEALFNHASMGILVVNSNGIILSVNPFALNLFCYTADEIIDKPIEILIPNRFHHRHVDHRENYTHNPKSRLMGLGMALFGSKKNGNEFPVEVSLGTYEKDGDKNIIAFISDNSSRKNAEAEIIKLNDELEATVAQRTKQLTDAMHQLEKSKEELLRSLANEKELSELKSRFVSMASHEFRTPLSTVLSSSYLIEKYVKEEDQPKREKHLQRIVSSVNMLTDILNDFLSVGKIEEGKIPVRISYFNIKSHISDVIEEIRNNLKPDQQIKYTHKGETEVELDSSLMTHIIMNLVSNASKFSAEGNFIEVETTGTEQQLILRVKDNGIGISKEDQKHLWERFFRGANVANIKGTGLGLHIISKYAELMNGTIACNSELEKGSEFILTFNKK